MNTAPLTAVLKGRRRRPLTMDDLEYVNWFLKSASSQGWDLKLAPLMGTQAGDIWTVAEQGIAALRSARLGEDLLVMKHARAFRRKTCFSLFFSDAGADQWAYSETFRDLASALRSIADSYRSYDRRARWREQTEATQLLPSPAH